MDQDTGRAAAMPRGKAPLRSANRIENASPLAGIIGTVFFVSGFPALVYQLVWQRSLFTIYGINIESVTVVVTGFMFGLGIGSLFGGELSKRRPLPLLVMFGCIDLAIGAFGAVSLQLFHAVGAATLGAPAIIVKLAPLLLLLGPTLLMGSTLPILVMRVVEHSGNVGKSVGLLYFLNTLGSAVACFVVALWMMRTLGMQGSILVAVGFNVVAGVAALLIGIIDAHAARRHSARPMAAPIGPGTARAAPMRFSLALGLSLSVGCLSLSYEIVWFRLFSFLTGGSALAFALVLGAFLFGIAVGSTGGWHLSYRVADYRGLQLALSLLIIASSILGFLYFPAVAFLASSGLSQYIFVPAILALVALGAGMMGAVFPLLSHVAVLPDSRAGARLSYLYLANILGSVTGSLGTGFVLMEYLGIETIAQVLMVAGLALALVVVLSLHRTGVPLRRWGVVAAAVVLAVLAVPLVTRPLFADGYERMLYQRNFGTEARVVDTIENRHGIINVTSDNVVYGGGMYDGRAIVSLADDVNILERPFSLSLIHPDPREILMIGLGSGSWTQVLASHPQLEKLTILEINPGYLSLIAKHAEVASILRSPKVHIVIDDARRWLNRHDEKFDAIVQNTTFYFRANVTNLLSEEYLRLLLAHLKPGGVAMYNTVWSDRAQRTACVVPPHGLRIQSMMAIANEAPVLDRDRWESVVRAYRIDGEPVLDLTKPQHAKRFGELKADLVMQAPGKQAPPSFLETCGSILQRTAAMRTMTDDNMGEEWNFVRATRVFGR
jgi:spermidine synthase